MHISKFKDTLVMSILISVLHMALICLHIVSFEGKLHKSAGLEYILL